SSKSSNDVITTVSANKSVDTNALARLRFIIETIEAHVTQPDAIDEHGKVKPIHCHAPTASLEVMRLAELYCHLKGYTLCPSRSTVKPALREPEKTRKAQRLHEDIERYKRTGKLNIRHADVTLGEMARQKMIEKATKNFDVESNKSTSKKSYKSTLG